jgi:hypothetical protein
MTLSRSRITQLMDRSAKRRVGIAPGRGSHSLMTEPTCGLSALTWSSLVSTSCSEGVARVWPDQSPLALLTSLGRARPRTRVDQPIRCLQQAEPLADAREPRPAWHGRKVTSRCMSRRGDLGYRRGRLAGWRSMTVVS